MAAAQEAQAEGHGLTPGEVFQGWLPILVLIAIVVAWTGPWSKLPSIIALHYQVNAASSLAPGATVAAVFNWTPFVGGTAILASWIVVTLLFRVSGSQLAKIFATTWSQLWGAMLVGVFIFGLAYVFNFSGMAGSLAKAFSEIGPYFIVVAPLLGFIGVALSGSNTSTNAMFGKFQALVGQLLVDAAAHPGHVRRSDAVIVLQDSARPDIRRELILRHADLLALEIGRRLDPIGAHVDRGMAERA